MSYTAHNLNNTELREETVTDNIFTPMYNFNCVKSDASTEKLQLLVESLIKQAQISLLKNSTSTENFFAVADLTEEWKILASDDFSSNESGEKKIMYNDNYAILKNENKDINITFISFINKLLSLNIYKLYINTEDDLIDACIIIDNNSNLELRDFINICSDYRKHYPKYDFEVVAFDEDEVTEGFSPTANIIFQKSRDVCGN